MQLERKSKFSLEKFQKDYLKANKPIIVTDTMENWEAINYHLAKARDACKAGSTCKC
jgi:hypothetical protein